MREDIWHGFKSPAFSVDFNPRREILKIEHQPKSVNGLTCSNVARVYLAERATKNLQGAHVAYFAISDFDVQFDYLK